ncbi:DUF3667 domain-containing protein [Cecembia lonarensis]|uniref:DUF3667 domain-containing protein n=1 Tax=Cecembia lonarensis (strain CCUG 58316 / KCTC 22772 / LW9) TaxID=1225176 RepID=K1L492_CECL9|nr:DUF3667 domain-containing protein [Cecembia lonarensis]EKB49616.1 hypothetical protein B879_01729 [Cecembia lonarensis LW9]
MKKNRKLDHCLNCGEQFHQKENFCPICGQENKDQRVSIGLFLRDFISNFINFDTTFFRTIPPFLFKPGVLTNEFNEGRRKKYIKPIKLYLLFSLFYFFIFGLMIPKNALDNFFNTLESLQGQEAPAGLNLEELEPHEESKLDSILQNKALPFPLKSTTSLEASEGQKDGPQKKISWKALKVLAMDPDISDSLFAQSLHEGFINVGDMISIKKQRSFVANSSLFISGVARNLPLMMFFLLPFFAFLLYLLYIRSDKYYVEHLIHGLHLHSFAYFIYGLAILFLVGTGNTSIQIVLWAFILVSIYAYFSIKKVYGQGWFTTLFKFLFLGVVYITLLSVGLLVETYVTLMLM